MTAARIVIATPHKRYDALETALRDAHGLDVVRIRERDTLTREQLQAIAPRFVFLPYWASSTEWTPGTSGPVFAPTVFYDITASLQAKLDALAAYASEMRPFPHARSLKALEALALWRGASCGVEAAEAFALGRARR